MYAVFAKKMPGSGGKRGVVTKRGVVHGVTMKEIRYLNRDGANNQDTGTSTPGEYYLAVSLSRKAEDKAFAVPMTVTIGMQGTAGAGKPEYVDGATPVSGDTVTPSPTPSAEPSQPSQPTDEKTEAGGPVKDNGSSSTGDGAPVGLIAGLGGGALLLVLVGAWSIVRLRRQPVAAHSQQPPPQYPQQQYPPQQYPPQAPNQGPPGR